LLLVPACSSSKGGSQVTPGSGSPGPGGNASGAAESLANALAFQNEGATTIDGALPGESEGAPSLEPSTGEGTITPGGVGSVRIKVADEDPSDPVIATLVWFDGASSFFSLPVGGATKEDDGTIANTFTVSSDVCDDLCNIVHQVKCYEAAQTTSGLITQANLQTVLLECTGSGDPAKCGTGGGGTADAGTGGDVDAGGPATDPLEPTTVTMGGKSDTPGVGFAKPIKCADGTWYWVHTYLSDGFDPVQIYGPPEPGTSRSVGTDAEMDEAGDCHGKSHSLMRLSCDGPAGPLCDEGAWASTGGTVSAEIVEGTVITSSGDAVQGPFIEYTFDVTMANGDETTQLTGSFRVRQKDVDMVRPE
jgi:hypothetical protein